MAMFIVGYLGIALLDKQCKGVGIEENALTMKSTAANLANFNRRQSEYSSLLRGKSSQE